MAEDFDSRNSFAVVWTVDTEDSELYKHTIADQATKLLELWTNGVVENVYLDNKTPDEALTVKKGDRGKVVFFIKARTESDARKVLDEMPLVKKKVAKYTLFPVGVLWLKQF
ncbi:MAG: hypothetical protein ACKE8R_09700 [Methylophagaceae bacterium]